MEENSFEIKGILLDIRRDLNRAPNSAKFWNLMILIVLVVSGSFSLDLLIYELVIGSIITIILALNDDVENHFWALFMPISLGCILLFLSGYLLYSVYMNTIVKFNNWLDKKCKKWKI